LTCVKVKNFHHYHTSIDVTAAVVSEILDGDVLFSDNMQMCFDSTINWKYILNRGDKAHFTLKNKKEYMKSLRCEGTILCVEWADETKTRVKPTVILNL